MSFICKEKYIVTILKLSKNILILSNVLDIVMHLHTYSKFEWHMLGFNLDSFTIFWFFSQFYIFNDLEEIGRIDNLWRWTSDTLRWTLLISIETFLVAPWKWCTICASIILLVKKLKIRTHVRTYVLLLWYFREI